MKRSIRRSVVILMAKCASVSSEASLEAALNLDLMVTVNEWDPVASLLV